MFVRIAAGAAGLFAFVAAAALAQGEPPTTVVGRYYDHGYLAGSDARATLSLAVAEPGAPRRAELRFTSTYNLPDIVLAFASNAEWSRFALAWGRAADAPRPPEADFEQYEDADGQIVFFYFQRGDEIWELGIGGLEYSTLFGFTRPDAERFNADLGTVSAYFGE